MVEPLKIGVLLSGSGTNLQAIIDAAGEGLAGGHRAGGVVAAGRVRHRAGARGGHPRDSC